MHARYPNVGLGPAALSSALVLALGTPFARAAPAVFPSGASVVAGSATVSPPNATATSIVQTSQKAIINWESFSIGATSAVTFRQPNSAAITLNRVTGPDASVINGKLVANGQIWLVNSNGILFGQGSHIDLGGLIATTSDIRDSDFLADNYGFAIPSANRNAAVINQGSIHISSGGSAVLSAARVANDGTIQADLGRVVLGGADAFAVNFDGDNLIRYAITSPVAQSPQNADGQSAPDLVSNSGTIAAQGGKVLLTARAARSVVNNVINSTGIIEATTASIQNGEIILDAGEGGTVNVAGNLDVSGKNDSESGGKISLLADSVTVEDGARLDASGDAGGGTILIGGNLNGMGPEPNAQSVHVGEAIITADATRNGAGGTVTVYSTGDTSIAGSISTTGGANGGNGGEVETSGDNLQVAGTTRVDTSASNGMDGSWLLNPQSFDIDAGFSATIANTLAVTNVTLQGNNVTLSAPLNYDSANSLSVLAQGVVWLKASLQNSGSGAILVAAGWDGVTAPGSLFTAPAAYGRDNGTIVIGGAGATGGVALGSMSGSTTLAGHDLVLNAANGYAQLGYHGSGMGSIAANLTGSITLTGGAGTGAFAQIGNGGYLSRGSDSGAIALNAGGDVNVTAGNGLAAYAQIGHGGNGSDGDQSGNISVRASGDLTLTGGRIGNEGSTIAGTALVSSEGNLTLAAGASVDAAGSGDALVLAAGGDFINQSGAGALNVTGGGRWLAFLNDPADKTAGGLTASPFYNRVFDFSTATYASVPAVGNRFVYALAPTLTVTPDGLARTYGAANPFLTATVTGVVGDDSLSSSFSGAPLLSASATASSGVGDYPIVGNLGTLASDFNYGFRFASTALHIAPATLTAGLTGTVAKLYDGTNSATLVPGNYTLTGLLPGDNAALSNPAVGQYADGNVGTDKLVSVSGLTIFGASALNYVLASVNASAPIGVINAAVSKPTVGDGVLIDFIVRPLNPPLSSAVEGPGLINRGTEDVSDATSATSDTAEEADLVSTVTDSLGKSLSGAPGSVHVPTAVLIEGLLRQFQPAPGGLTPHGVPPVGQVYSSWGNEAFWQ